MNNIKSMSAERFNPGFDDGGVILDSEYFSQVSPDCWKRLVGVAQQIKQAELGSEYLSKINVEIFKDPCALSPFSGAIDLELRRELHKALRAMDLNTGLALGKLIKAQHIPERIKSVGILGIIHSAQKDKRHRNIMGKIFPYGFACVAVSFIASMMLSNINASFIHENITIIRNVALSALGVSASVIVLAWYLQARFHKRYMQPINDASKQIKQRLLDVLKAQIGVTNEPSNSAKPEPKPRSSNPPAIPATTGSARAG